MLPTRPARFGGRKLYLSLLLFTLPACGLSEYEALMREAEQREQRFRAESRYLDEPVKVPTRKEKDIDVPMADMFFRPPKGIQSAFLPEPRGGLLWQYTARKNTGDFALVEMAFGDDKKEFASDVLRHYQAPEQVRSSARQLKPPDRESLTFTVWEFDDAGYSYSIAVWQGGRTQIAIAYVFPSGHRESAGKARDNLGEAIDKTIQLSLESLAVDRAANAARQRYRHKSPWRLGSAPIR